MALQAGNGGAECVCVCACVCLTVPSAAGDTVGVAFDQSDEKVLRIYHNGQYLSGQDVRGMRGETWPIIIVAGGAKLEVRRCFCLRLPAHAPCLS